MAVHDLRAIVDAIRAEIMALETAPPNDRAAR